MSDNDLTQRDERYQLRVRNLHKSFGKQHVLRGVDLDIERHKINIIIGGSGQGKSVLCKHLMGLLKPDEGHIYVDGQDIIPLAEVEMNVVRRKFGMLFQHAALFDSMTVEENVAFPLKEHSGLGRKQIREKVIEKLALLGLRNAEAKMSSELSGGMAKRVGLARAIVLEPEILIYDEPTTGLDPIATKNVDNMIAETAQQLGVTSIVISHDMASTFRIADRIFMLQGGRIVANGTPPEILASTNEDLRVFVETSGTVKFGQQSALTQPQPPQPQPGDLA